MSDNVVGYRKDVMRKKVGSDTGRRNNSAGGQRVRKAPEAF